MPAPSAKPTPNPGNTRRGAVFVFAAASLLAIALGALAMAQADVPVSIWIRNPIAWLVAGALSLFLARRGWLGVAMAPVALIVVALSFLGPDQQGVHRWLDFGPVQLNAAALVLPAAIAAFARTPATIAIPIFAIIAALLAWQPDISQLIGFSLAGIILVSGRFGWRGVLAAAVIAAAAIAVCLSRADPLLPVAHVEGIFLLAWSQHPVLAVAMGVALAATCLSPLLLSPIAELRGPAMALSGYFALTGASYLLGAYPVPLAGYGLSFVLGWWLALAGLSFHGLRSANSLTAA